jgi:hypothetical protein
MLIFIYLKNKWLCFFDFWQHYTMCSIFLLNKRLQYFAGKQALTLQHDFC